MSFGAGVAVDLPNHTTGLVTQSIAERVGHIDAHAIVARHRRVTDTKLVAATAAPTATSAKAIAILIARIHLGSQRSVGAKPQRLGRSVESTEEAACRASVAVATNEVQGAVRVLSHVKPTTRASPDGHVDHRLTGLSTIRGSLTASAGTSLCTATNFSTTAAVIVVCL